jgi:hypothetical protein
MTDGLTEAESRPAPNGRRLTVDGLQPRMLSGLGELVDLCCQHEIVVREAAGGMG